MAQPGKMVIGVNYPWQKYGLDFGPVVQNKAGTGKAKRSDDPNAWDAPLPANKIVPPGDANIDAAIAGFKKLGVEIVRWFLLGDGWAFGDVDYNAFRSPAWTYALPSDISAWLDDVEMLIDRFAGSGIKLMPVLFDFMFFMNGEIYVGKDIYGQDRQIKVTGDFTSIDAFAADYFAKATDIVRNDTYCVDWNRFVRGGKAQIITDPTLQKAFIAQVLDPLLARSANYKKAIFAWDICNEPDYGVRAYGLPKDDLARMLVTMAERVVKRGMNATIGMQTHKSLNSTSFFPVDAMGRLKALEQTGDPERFPQFLWQHHYYPDGGDGSDMPPPKQGGSPRSKVILGEFLTALDKPCKGPWESGWPRDMAQRLKILDGQNYGYALPWSASLNDGQSHWTPDVQKAVKAYTGAK